MTTTQSKTFRGSNWLVIVRANRVRVQADGSVSVYDSVAGHYTTCHSLSENAVRRARKLAKVGS